ADKGHAIKAVMIVHNETSTGVTSNIPALRQAIDRARHPALLMVDAISSLGASDEIASTISKAGCRARSMAWRSAGMLLVTPVEVSLWTIMTALIACPLS